MPQITVTIADDIYWDMMNLPKGLKSKFVNEAIKDAINKCDDLTGRGTVCPARMHAFARGRLGTYEASLHEDQEKIIEEKPKTAMEEWADMQKELHG